MWVEWKRKPREHCSCPEGTTLTGGGRQVCHPPSTLLKRPKASWLKTGAVASQRCRGWTEGRLGGWGEAGRVLSLRSRQLLPDPTAAPWVAASHSVLRFSPLPMLGRWYAETRDKLNSVQSSRIPAAFLPGVVLPHILGYPLVTAHICEAEAAAETGASEAGCGEQPQGLQPHSPTARLPPWLSPYEL